MHDFLKFHHNCDAHVGVQKKTKKCIFNCIWTSREEALSLFAAQYSYRNCLWMFLSSGSSISRTSIRFLPSMFQ